MDIEARVEEAAGFLGNIFQGKTIFLPQAELRNRGKSNQSFHEGQTRFLVKPGSQKMEGWLYRVMEKADRGSEIFYSPTPMSGASGRKKTQALSNAVVHGDADLGLTPEAHQKLVQLGACLVRSGGTLEDGRPKYHVYLLLTEEISPNEVERLNRGLRHLIQGDKFDVTSLLRVPGTRNHKYPGKPLVTVERLATQKHKPSELAKHLPVPEGEVVIGGVELAGMKMPEVPPNFDPKAPRPGFAKLRNTLRNWNGRFEEDKGLRRYMAAVALVKDGIAKGASVDEIYAFAMMCEPLKDKAEEENGYSIQKDIAKTYYRHTKTAPQSAMPSGTLTVEKFERFAGKAPAPHEPAADEIGEAVPPKAFQRDDDGPNPYSSRDNRNYLDMAIFTSGDFKPLEPAYFSVAGSFCLLYPGMTHCIFGDSGSGKTWIVLAQIAEELKAGRRVKFIDFENGAMTIGNRLRNVLGVPAELLTPDHFKYMWFNDKPDPAEVDEEAQEGYDLVVIDGVDASLALWEITDVYKPSEIRKWYNAFPQRFADEGATVLVIDHTTKKASQEVKPKDQQPGGAGTKLAVLTGAAFYVHPREGYELVPGRRGIVEGYVTRKDKDGFLKSKARKDGRLFQFIIDTVDGETVVEFEAAKEDAPTARDYRPTPEERNVLDILTKTGKPVAKGQLTRRIGGNRQSAYRLIDEMAAKGLLLATPGERGSIEISLASAPPASRDLDMTNADKRRKPKRECSKCGEMEVMVEPDDLGYQEGRSLCHSCAGENIEPEDGAEWARGVRERAERTNTRRGRSQRS